MHTRGAGLNHGLHQFKRIQHATEPGFGIGDDRREVIHVALTPGALDFIGAFEGVVDAPNHGGNRIDCIKRLIRIHGLRGIAVGRHLPARQVDGLHAGFYLLHGLAAGHRAQAVDVIFLGNELPQPLGAPARQGVLNLHGTAQLDYVRGAVIPLDVRPARVLRPVLFYLCYVINHSSLLSCW